MSNINIHDNPPAHAVEVEGDDTETPASDDDETAPATDADGHVHPDAVPATFVPPGAPLGASVPA